MVFCREKENKKKYGTYYYWFLIENKRIGKKDLKKGQNPIIQKQKYIGKSKEKCLKLAEKIKLFK